MVLHSACVTYHINMDIFLYFLILFLIHSLVDFVKLIKEMYVPITISIITIIMVTVIVSNIDFQVQTLNSKCEIIRDVGSKQN